MATLDTPLELESQIDVMKKYVTFTKRIKMRRMLQYSGYFRISRYGKFLISHTSILRSKPNQELLYKVYDFDVELRKVFYYYCKRAELQFKTHFSDSISLKLNDPVFYLDDNYYTKSKGERDRNKRSRNISFYSTFKRSVVNSEKDLRKKVNKFPEFKEYRRGGTKARSKIPCWSAFSYFDFGTITNMYSYLRGDLRKEILSYGYSRSRYGKQTTKQVDTWLDAIRNLRNVCAHHNKLVGKTSSVVLCDDLDDNSILLSDTDLFSRIYALKKILNEKDALALKKDIQKVVNKAKFDIYLFNILPNNWEELFDRIISL